MPVQRDHSGLALIISSAKRQNIRQGTLQPVTAEAKAANHARRLNVASTRDLKGTGRCQLVPEIISTCIWP
jgi:hypothetical protein